MIKGIQKEGKVITSVNTTRKTINTTFSSCFGKNLQLIENVSVAESISRKTSLQSNHHGLSRESPMEHYKRTVSILLLGSLINKMVKRFAVEGCHACELLCYAIDTLQFRYGTL